MTDCVRRQSGPPRRASRRCAAPFHCVVALVVVAVGAVAPARAQPTTASSPAAAATPSLAPPAAAPSEASPPPPESGELPWVVFVRVIDTTRAGLEAKVSDTVKRSILKTEVNVVPTEDLAAAARKRAVPRKRWAEEGALATVAKDVGADFLVFARVKSSRRYAYEVELYAVDAASGAKVASQRLEVAGDIARGKTSGGPSASDVDALVQRLIRALPAPSAPRAELAPPAVVDPATGAAAGAAAADDAAWGGDWGADGGPVSASTAETGVSQVLQELQADFGGRVGVDTFGYVADLIAPPDVVEGIDKVASRQQVDLALRASVGGKAASGNAALLLRKDFADPTRDRFEAEEAYADVDLFGVRVRGGRSYNTWGTVDLVSPTDILSPFDFRDLLDIEKRPTWLLKVAYGIGPVTLEGYYLPLVEPHLLPLPEAIADDGTLAGTNRWVKGPSGVDVAGSPVPLRFGLDLGNVPAPSLENAQGALRVRGSAFGADASIGYAYLFDRFPALVTKAVAAQPLPLFADVTISDQLLRRHLLTLDGELPLGKLRFSGEALVAFQPDADDVDVDELCAGADECELTVEDPYATVALGVDWETPRFFDDHSVRIFFDVTATAELAGAGGKDLELRLPDFDDPISRLRHPLPLAALSRVDYLVGDTVRVEMLVINNFARLDLDDPPNVNFDVDMLVVPAVQALFADVVTARVEAAFLVGNDDGAFGRYPENTRVGASLGVSF